MRLDMQIGDRFGILTVIGLVPGKKFGPRPRAICRCDCGVEKSIEKTNLTRGHIRSCTCIKGALLSESKTQHGGWVDGKASPEYVVWQAMKRRCLVPEDEHYPDYGGRGIAICERWLSFENFLADMGKRPNGKTLDRFPNNDGNYEPGNCRWATSSEQASNRRGNVHIEFRGEKYLQNELAKKLGITASSLKSALKSDSIEGVAGRIKGGKVVRRGSH